MNGSFDPSLRIHVLLGVGAGLQVLGLAAGVALIVTQRPQAAIAAGALLGVAALVAIPALRHRNRPVSWPGAALCLSVPQGIGLGLAAGGAAGPVIAAGAALAPVACAVAATRTFRRLPPAAAGSLGFDIVAKLRRGGRARPRWTDVDNATISGVDILVAVRSGRTGAAGFAIPLATLRAVVVRPATAGTPCVSLPDGTTLPLPDGAVAELQTDHHAYRLPVVDPAYFAAAATARAARLRATARV